MKIIKEDEQQIELDARSVSGTNELDFTTPVVFGMIGSLRAGSDRCLTICDRETTQNRCRHEEMTTQLGEKQSNMITMDDCEK